MSDSLKSVWLLVSSLVSHSVWLDHVFFFSNLIHQFSPFIFHDMWVDLLEEKCAFVHTDTAQMVRYPTEMIATHPAVDMPLIPCTVISVRSICYKILMIYSDITRSIQRAVEAKGGKTANRVYTIWISNIFGGRTMNISVVDLTHTIIETNLEFQVYLFFFSFLRLLVVRNGMERNQHICFLLTKRIKLNSFVFFCFVHWVLEQNYTKPDLKPNEKKTQESQSIFIISMYTYSCIWKKSSGRTLILCANI